MNALGAALTPLPDCTGLVVGYSGGLDSTALLHALGHRGADAPPLRAVHVCHHLQSDAERWAGHCAAQCAAWRIRFTRLDVRVDICGQGMEAAARAARYMAIADALTPGEVLVSAHHARDQAETFLLQALRGAGPKGLAGMPRLAELGAGRHWRPWLAIERDAIRAYAEEYGLNWVEDPSNRDRATDRGYLRQTLWPLLEARWPAAALTLSRSAAHAADAAASIAATAEVDLAAMVDPDDALTVSTLAKRCPARQREAVRRWLADTGADRPDHRHVDAILGLADARGAASPRVHFGATDVRFFNGRLYAMAGLAPAPVADLDWDGARPLPLPADCGELQAALEPLVSIDLSVGFRAGGERLDDGRGHHRRLKDVLRERRVAPWLRGRIPLVRRQGRIVAVADVWRHPQIERLLGVERAAFRWQQALAGAAARVVDR